MILVTRFLCKIHSLGLGLNPVSIQALLDSKKVADTSGVKVVWRNRRDSPIKLRSVLADTVCYPGDAVVNTETGFYVVKPGESVIFISSAASAGSDSDGGASGRLHIVGSQLECSLYQFFFRISGGTCCSPWHRTVF